MAHDIFISYSSKNTEAGSAVCAALEARGIRCWMAPRDILPGNNHLQSGIDYKLPTGGPDVQFELDDTPGTETMYIVASLKPMKKIHSLLNNVYDSSKEDRKQAIVSLTGKLKESGKSTQRIQSGSTPANNELAEKMVGRGSLVRVVSFKHK